MNLLRASTGLKSGDWASALTTSHMTSTWCPTSCVALASASWRAEDGWQLFGCQPGIFATRQVMRVTTVKDIHQQVNVTQGGQAVVAGEKVMSRTRGRRRSGGGMVKDER
jgi:hypothetical protein